LIKAHLLLRLHGQKLCRRTGQRATSARWRQTASSSSEESANGQAGTEDSTHCDDECKNDSKIKEMPVPTEPSTQLICFMIPSFFVE
jgi:hypothetical protein